MMKNRCLTRDMRTLLLPSVSAHGPSSLHRRTTLSRRLAISSARCGRGDVRGGWGGNAGIRPWGLISLRTNQGLIYRETLLRPDVQPDGRTWGRPQSQGLCWAGVRGQGLPRGPPLTSLVSVLNLRFWMVLWSCMLVSSFIIWF